MAENNYDLCLFDIMLPGVNGYELLEYAKSLHMPVIFLTAKGETAAYIMQKGWTLEEFYGAL